MKGICRIVKVLDYIQLKVSMLCILVVFAIVILAVFYRYALQMPLAWSDMVARYLLIWIIGLAVLPAYRRGAHIGVDVVVRHLPAGAKKIAEATAFLCQIVFYVVLVVFGIKYTIFAVPLKSEIWGISLGWIYVTVAVFSAGALLHFLCWGFGKTLGSNEDSNKAISLDN